MLDGKTDSLIWSLSFPVPKLTQILLLDFLTTIQFLDIFCNYAIGVFPDLRRSIRFMVDGRTGKMSLPGY